MFIILFNDKGGEHKKTTQTWAGNRYSLLASLLVSCCPVVGSVRGSLFLESCGDGSRTHWTFPEEDRLFFCPSKSSCSNGINIIPH